MSTDKATALLAVIAQTVVSPGLTVDAWRKSQWHKFPMERVEAAHLAHQNRRKF